MIRSAQPGDLDSILELERSGDESLVQAGIEFPEELEELYSKDVYDLAFKQGNIFVADIDGVVGYYFWQVLDNDAYLAEIDVHQHFQQRGIGTELLNHFLDEARAEGHSFAWLTTFRDVPFNMPFYKKHGFAVVDLIECGPELTESWNHERSTGIVVAPRVVMRRSL